MTTNVLDPSSILHNISQLIPNTLQSPYDGLMAASHVAMISVGFKYAGLGDDARQEGDGSQSKLPEEWNQQGPHVYSIRYSHPQSCLTFVIKSIKLGDKFIIHGMGIGDNKVASLEISPADYTSSSFYPYALSSSDQPLVNGFISSTRFNDFLLLYKINIIQRLIPGLTKPGYTEEPSTNTTTTTATQPSSAQPQSTQPSSTTSPPRPPIFDPSTSPDDPISRNPLSVGQDDLNPFGNSIRLPGSHFGSGGGGGGGMFVGPNHPMFNNRNDDPSGLFGGPNPLPRGSVPPGARFDPIGPFGSNPLRGGSGGRGRGRGGRFSGEPDNDELPPPGYDNMFM
ncbi:PI31 proteasome regulator N-terminal-domain-containing protein [Cunninghamella echinulata]|nr:PI31 proteasome regulator N-terminal-domain-containing protein [Cunninghamella echinulata]